MQVGDEGLKSALMRLHKADDKYRFMLTGHEKVFGT